MQFFNIPTTELKVSRIAMGCMTIGGNWTKAPLTSDDVRTAHAAVDAALESGINFFDHADFYSCYKSEEVFGKLLQERKGLRDKIIIQSKCSIRPSWETDIDKVGMYDFSYEYIIGSVEKILKRLKIETLDLLLLHRPDPLGEPAEVGRAFADLLKQGKVKYFGVSNHSSMQIEILRKHVDVPLLFNQLRLNILFSGMLNGGVDLPVGLEGDPLPATMTFDYCKLHGIVVQAYGPQQHGFLTDRPLLGEQPEARYASQIWEIQKVAKKIAQEHGFPVESIPLAWLFRIPHIIQPVIGTTNPRRIKESCKAVDLKLSREEWYTLYTAGRGSQVP